MRRQMALPMPHVLSQNASCAAGGNAVAARARVLGLRAAHRFAVCSVARQQLGKAGREVPATNGSLEQRLLPMQSRRPPGPSGSAALQFHRGLHKLCRQHTPAQSTPALPSTHPVPLPTSSALPPGLSCGSSSSSAYACMWGAVGRWGRGRAGQAWRRVLQEAG